MSARIEGPFTLELKVHVVNDETGQVGSATYLLGPGQAPTMEQLVCAAGAVLAALPDGFSLMGGDEFFNAVIVKEKTGRKGNFAVPKSFQYDVADLTARARAAYVAPRGVEEIDEEDEFEDEDE